MNIDEIKNKISEVKSFLLEAESQLKSPRISAKDYHFLENKIISLKLDLDELEKDLKRDEGAAIMRATKF